MVKHTQTIRRQQPVVFDHFVGLARKGLTTLHLLGRLRLPLFLANLSNLTYFHFSFILESQIKTLHQSLPTNRHLLVQSQHWKH